MIEITKDDIKKEAARLMSDHPDRVSVEFRTLELNMLKAVSSRPLYPLCDIFPQRDDTLYYFVCGGVVSELDESESDYRGAICSDRHRILPFDESVGNVPFSRLLSFPRFFETLSLMPKDGLGAENVGEIARLTCSYFLCRII